MKILIIEDDLPTSKTIKFHLENENIKCDLCSTGEDGLQIAKRYDYDLIILDLILPDTNGYNILKNLRDLKITTPVLILSGLDEISNKIKGLGYGADDYLTKPFDKAELIARIHAITRRFNGFANSKIQIGRLTINLLKKTAEIDNKQLKLTQREYSILELLVLKRGTTLSKEVFLNNLYGGMEEPEFKIIDVFICKLRKKLSTALGGINYIETIWGRGYTFTIENDKQESKISTIYKKEKKTAV